jgi:hypothetical protein
MQVALVLLQQQEEEQAWIGDDSNCDRMALQINPSTQNDL